ncbi:MAG: aminopeptidase, partial [Smithella sp.]
MEYDTMHLAELIVDYSVKVKQGDRVLIVSEGLEGMPLVKALHRLCILRRASHVEYLFREPSFTRDFLTLATDEQLSFVPEDYYRIIKNISVYIWIGAPTNTKELSLVDEGRIALLKKALAPLREERLRSTRWIALLYPTQGLAQDASMSMEEFSHFFFAACLRDWEKEKEKMAPLKTMLDNCGTVAIEGDGTSLTFSLNNRESVCCAGEVNLPDGEIFIAPDKYSVQGTISFNMPAMYQGKIFDDISLTFEKGKVVESHSRSDSAELSKILDTDEGSRYLGEFAIGLNHFIDRQFFNPVFDEKIFGTVHLALGHCYPESDNGNKSGIHWDLIYSLKNNARFLFDGIPILENGKFVHQNLY